MFAKIREAFPANRVAFYLGILGAAGVALTTFQTSLVPGSPPAEAIAKAVVLLATVYKFGTMIEKFLEGSQNFDSLVIAGVPKNTTGGLVTNVVTDDDNPDDDLVNDEALSDPDAGVGSDPGTPPLRPRR